MVGHAEGTPKPVLSAPPALQSYNVVPSSDTARPLQRYSVPALLQRDRLAIVLNCSATRSDYGVPLHRVRGAQTETTPRPAHEIAECKKIGEDRWPTD
jgi:hypothetical protein